MSEAFESEQRGSWVRVRFDKDLGPHVHMADSAGSQKGTRAEFHQLMTFHSLRQKGKVSDLTWTIHCSLLNVILSIENTIIYIFLPSSVCVMYCKVQRYQV